MQLCTKKVKQHFKSKSGPADVSRGMYSTHLLDLKGTHCMSGSACVKSVLESFSTSSCSEIPMCLFPTSCLALSLRCVGLLTLLNVSHLCSIVYYSLVYLTLPCYLPPVPDYLVLVSSPVYSPWEFPCVWLFFCGPFTEFALSFYVLLPSFEFLVLSCSLNQLLV